MSEPKSMGHRYRDDLTCPCGSTLWAHQANPRRCPLADVPIPDPEFCEKYARRTGEEREALEQAVLAAITAGENSKAISDRLEIRNQRVSEIRRAHGMGKGQGRSNA